MSEDKQIDQEGRGKWSNSADKDVGHKDAKDIEEFGSIPSWRLWLFRLIAVTIVPAVLLLVVEISLRVVGYGYPAGALCKMKWKGQAAYCNNYRFGWRFWPPKISREPFPYIFSAKKAENTYRIFILGGSAALGTPDSSYSFGRVLEVMLKSRYPHVNFEIINTAITAINSHVVLPIAKSCGGRDGDLFIVYLGNNEVIGPYGAGTIFAPLSDNLAFIRFDKAIQATRIGQLFKNALSRKQVEKTLPKVWGGSKMFMENLIRKDNANLQVVYKHYKSNLEDITQAIIRKGAKVILCSVASNIKDCAPFASLHRSDITDDEKTKWDKLYEQGAEYEISGQHAQALESFLAAGEIDDTYADLHFRIARAYQQLGSFEKARNEYVLARETDALRLRADNRINETVRAVAENSKGKGVYFVDSVKAFEQHSPHNTPGSEVFYEHVHMNFKGGYILANTIFHEIEKILPQKVKSKRVNSVIITEQQCANKLAYTDWDKYNIAHKVLNDFITKAPFASRIYNNELVTLMEQELQNLKLSLDRPSLQRAKEQYRLSIGQAPADWWLRWKYGNLLTRALKDRRAGAEQYRIVTELVPHDYTSYVSYGSALSQLGNHDAAITSCLAALRINPVCANAHHVLGTSYAKKSRADKAMEHFSKLIRLRPEGKAGYHGLGMLLDKQGKVREAEEVYRRGLTFLAGNVVLHNKLAILLAKQKRYDEAIESLQAALNLNPDSIKLRRLLDKVKKARSNQVK